jgi:ribA/ribD-fused uncharacterized protein
MKITDKYVFFWNGIYSQWHPSRFEINDIPFTSCEQYMMYEKAMLFGDEEIAQQVLVAQHPDEQKRLGKLVKGFDRTIWDQNCFSIVYRGNYAKFTQNEDLKEQLLATGDRVLVEASPYDFIWGIKKGEDDDTIHFPSNWSGLNLLGFAIMTVRNQLR